MMKKFFISILIIILLIAGGGFFFLTRRGTNETSQKYKEFSFISEGNDIDKKDFAKIDGQYYLSLNFIKNNIDDSVHYDKKEKTVTFTNDAGTSRYVVNEKQGLKNSQKIELRDPIIEENGEIYIPLEAFIQDYPVKVRYIKDKKLLLLDRTDVEYAVGTPTGDGVNMREKDSKNSPVVAILNKDDKVYVYGEEGDFYLVRQKDGYAGYIKKNLLKVDYAKDLFKTKKTSEKKEAVKPLNLTWDYTYGPEKKEKIDTISKIPGLDIICPTWFSVSNNNGDLIDRGSSEYVQKYNSLGIKVWGYLDNSFNPEITHNVLSSTSKREKVIAKTLELAKKYNMPGINLDFEHINTEDRDNYTQFVRELSAQFHAENIKVSVDVTPQISSDLKKEKYNREEIAKVADYVVVMAYDQHWKNSSEAGSVAEYKWVESNINMLFRSIPYDKMILGVPLYSRLWTEKGDKVTSSTLSMQQANDIMLKHKLTPKWDKVAKQDYVEFKDANATYKIWLENASSIKYKVSLVNKYNLAGVGSWRKGFETPDIWNVIEDTLK